uniref:Chymotrypsin-like elastase family member 1 n=1 Tax=Schistocephalus solidus TaxID=70667 RepID=A0A0V0J465_SCHSO
MVKLVFFFKVGLWSQVLGAFPFCGGTLISNSLIVTAGHCLQTYFKCTRFPVGIDIFLSEERSKALQILVGGHDFTSYDGYDQFFTVQRAIVHPDYNQDAILHSTDLVILQIDGQITFSTLR